ncbi:MAG: cytochrome P450 [Anaerolineae bacterium]|nr:cytochrome P450 [Anaerolineae bacterium]
MVSIQQAQKQPAGVRGLPIVGSLPDFARDPIKFITRLQRDYGDVAAFSLMGLKGVLISDPADIERVLLETGKRYGKFSASYALRTILGNGLVTSEGDFWKRQRKLVAPAFHHQSIKQYADQMVAYAQDMANTWENGAARDIHEDMMTLTQRIIMKVLFSVDVLDNAKGTSEAFNAMMQALGAQMSGVEAVLPNFVPTPTRTKMIEGVAYINNLLMEIIEKRRAEGSGDSDLLTMLMDARDDDGQPMSTEQMLDEIRSLYLAGHETTAATLSWAWLLLSHNPVSYAKLEAEIADVLKGRTPTSDDVPNLPYCNAVIKEALRCYPVAWITQRVAMEDVEIGGYAVAKDTAVWLSPWIVQHDPRWYAEPDTFMPERWLKDKAEQPKREAYIPFGGGPHICIGNGLAMMEAVLLMATMLQQYHIEMLPSHPVEYALTGTLRPKFGVQVKFTQRDLQA